MVQKLVQTGMAFPNPMAKWASAPLIVSKPDQTEFFFTVDLRAVGHHTLRLHYPLFTLENELPELASASFFANFVLSDG